MRNLRLVSLFALAVLPFAGCASQESFQVPVVRPAPVDLGRHDIVAVDRFAGDGAESLDIEMTTALREAVNPLTNEPDFEVVHRRDVDRMIDDMRRYPGANLDTEDSPVAKWKRAPIQIGGEVHAHCVEEQVERTQWVDPQGHVRTTFVRRAMARVDVTIQAVDSEGNSVFDRVRFDEQVGATTKAVGEDAPPIDHDALLAAARDRVVQAYLKRVMPHFDYVSVHLYVDGDLPQLQVGNGFARTGDWQSALETYQSALAAAGDETRHKALHNVGVAQLYTDRFDDARQSLKQAYALEQDDATLRQLEMVAQREQELQILEEQSQRHHAAPSR